MMSMRRKKGQKGFTMIELMVVVVIVGILAAIAIPLYGKYIKNSRVTEATARIGEIITAAKAYAQEHTSDTTPFNPTWPPAIGGGIVDLTSSQYFDYTITAGGGLDATANALTIHAAGKGKMALVTVDVTVANINVNGSAPTVGGL
jgi:prepilin-type N-terminal cleavage/methylation domain-containing protein